MSHGTHLNESWHTFEWVMAHIQEIIAEGIQEVSCVYTCVHMNVKEQDLVYISVTICIRKGKSSTNLSPSGRIRQIQNTTSCDNSGTMNWNSIRISTVRGHAPYKYPPRNTMPKSPGTNSNPLRISWSDTSFSPTVCKSRSQDVWTSWHTYITQVNMCVYMYVKTARPNQSCMFPSR